MSIYEFHNSNLQLFLLTLNQKYVFVLDMVVYVHCQNCHLSNVLTGPTARCRRALCTTPGQGVSLFTGLLDESPLPDVWRKLSVRNSQDWSGLQDARGQGDSC